MTRLRRVVLTLMTINIAAMIAANPGEAHRPPAPLPTVADIAMALQPNI